MDTAAALKTIKQLIGQTPLIIDPDRDGVRFQEALSAISTEKLQSYHRNLNSEDRRRFHYVSNVCLGYESWSRLYQDLVVHETRARLTDSFEEAYAHRAEELRHREQELKSERSTLEEDLMRLEGENHSLRLENIHLQREQGKLQQTVQTLQRQHEQLLSLVERYKRLLQELKRFLPPSATATTGQSPQGLRK
jgi:chromosome segregation ATPase